MSMGANDPRGIANLDPRGLIGRIHVGDHTKYEGRAESSVTSRLPCFYPRYILKCFTALEWCVE